MKAAQLKSRQQKLS